MSAPTCCRNPLDLSGLGSRISRLSDRSAACDCWTTVLSAFEQLLDATAVRVPESRSLVCCCILVLSSFRPPLSSAIVISCSTMLDRGHLRCSLRFCCRTAASARQACLRLLLRRLERSAFSGGSHRAGESAVRASSGEASSNVRFRFCSCDNRLSCSPAAALLSICPALLALAASELVSIAKRALWSMGLSYFEATCPSQSPTSQAAQVMLSGLSRADGTRRSFRSPSSDLVHCSRRRVLRDLRKHVRTEGTSPAERFAG